MNITEMYEKVREVYEQYKDQYSYLGLRFEDKEREIGEECEWSKHNPYREDEREFPEFGTDEYDELPELNGTSCWYLGPYEYKEDFYPGWGYGAPSESDNDRSLVGTFQAYHAYVIAGNRLGHHDDPDDGEILIWDAVVVAKIF